MRQSYVSACRLTLYFNSMDDNSSAIQRLYTPNILHNQAVYNIRFISSCFAGAVAGILGLEKWSGFLFFALATAFGSFSIYAINLKRNPRKYLPGGYWELINPGQENLFSYILVWTLAYGEPVSELRGPCDGLLCSRSLSHPNYPPWQVYFMVSQLQFVRKAFRLGC